MRHRALALAVSATLFAACSSGKPAATTTSTTTSSSNTFHGSADSAFCTYVRQSRAAFSGTNSAQSPEQSKAAYERLLPVLEHAAAIAPDVIKQDFAAYVDGFRRLLRVLAAAKWDSEKVDRAKLQFLQARDLVVASQRVTQYMQQICRLGVTPSG